MQACARSTTTLVTRTVSVPPEIFPRHIGLDFDGWSLVQHEDDRRFLRFQDCPGASVLGGIALVINTDGYRVQTQAVLNATPVEPNPPFAHPQAV